MAALLKALAANGKGLCLVTTRHSIPNLRAYRSTNAPECDLKRLSKEAGAHLLKTLGVIGTQKEREALSEDAKGHALTLTLIGGYVRDAHGGDIRRRDLFELAEADEEEQGGHAFRAMAAYVQWFEQDKRGRHALGMLRLMGLFDRPADLGCLRALWRGPEIRGLTDAIVGLSEAHRNIAIKRLEDAKLLTVNRDAGGALVLLDAHPLLREYFAKELCEKNPDGWKAAHKRLYKHLCATETDKKDAPTLNELRPLYQAVAHGCHAGLQQEACEEVYSTRIRRGVEFYSLDKLGAFGTDLGTITCFFDAPWTRLSPNLLPLDQGWLLNAAAFCLRALGRLREALEPMRAGLDLSAKAKDWENAAISAGNVSELVLTVGDVAAAARTGALSVDYAHQSGSAFLPIAARTNHADALHQQGARDDAQALFKNAEAMQKDWQPARPLLYSMGGFRYCELLLGHAEREAWKRLILSHGAASGDPRVSETSPPSVLSRVYAISQNADEAIQSEEHDSGLLSSVRNDDVEVFEPLLEACAAVLSRAEQTLGWSEGKLGRLNTALDHLTLARAALYGAILCGATLDGVHIDAAVRGLRHAGTKHHQPRGLLVRALYRVVVGDFPGAQEDLDEAHEIAERGLMKLHLADIHLHRARLFGLYAKRPESYPWESPEQDLAEARRLIEECGYWRRKEELEDAEAAQRALALSLS
jgi:tetratricopeptide (TPR) repeat protein